MNIRKEIMKLYYTLLFYLWQIILSGFSYLIILIGIPFGEKLGGKFMDFFIDPLMNFQDEVLDEIETELKKYEY